MDVYVYKKPYTHNIRCSLNLRAHLKRLLSWRFMYCTFFLFKLMMIVGPKGGTVQNETRKKPATAKMKLLANGISSISLDDRNAFLDVVRMWNAISIFRNFDYQTWLPSINQIFHFRCHLRQLKTFEFILVLRWQIFCSFSQGHRLRLQSINNSVQYVRL